MGDIPGVVYDAKAVSELLNLKYTDEQLKIFGPPPPALPGYITYFDPGKSIRTVRNSVKPKSRFFYCREYWYDREDFASLKEKPRYRQLRVEPLRESLGMNFSRLRTILPAGEEIPTCRSIVMAIAVHLLATNEGLFSKYETWSNDLCRLDDRVSVCFCSLLGIYINGWDRSHSDERVGMATARKVS